MKWKKIYFSFSDTQLWKTKHPRKRFQNFLRSYVLSTYRIEIHQSQPVSMTLSWPEGHTSGVIGGFRSAVNNT